MPRLQATWTRPDRLFLWSPTTRAADALDELPLPEGVGRRARRALATHEGRIRRRKFDGLELSMHDALPVLTALETDARVSDSVRCWSFAAKLAVDLAARQRVVPTVVHGEARWRALLTHTDDRHRFDALVQALPPAGRAEPTTERGAVKLQAAPTAIRGFLDATVDHLYRAGAWPGPARGWVRQLADALRDEGAGFHPTDARDQGLPARIAAWAAGAERPSLRIGFALELPDPTAPVERFPLHIRLHAPGRPDPSLSVRQAWRSRGGVVLDGERWPHPGPDIVRALARAARLHPALGACLQGREPRDVELDADAAYAFLADGRRALEAAGFHVVLPEEFRAAGRQRIRPRIHLELPDGELSLADALTFRWEVVVGDTILSGEELSALAALDRPIVRFRGEWVLLDPEELGRLPDGIPQSDQLPAADALRAALTGSHRGVPVVVDERLDLVLQALRDPPETPTPEGLHGELRPYQHRGFSWLTTLGSLGLGCCLADDMGLGKTLQLITHVLARREADPGAPPALVVCPTSVLGNWQRELSRFAPSLSVMRWHGVSRRGAFDDHDVVLTTYGLLVRDPGLLEQAWDVVALDEAQAIKNPDSRRARASLQLKARHRVALTGTPVENRLDELWSLMHFLIPGLLGSRGAFRRNVAVPVERFGDEQVAERLKLGVAPFLLRRVKTDPTVIDDLPEKLERREWCVLTREQRELYREVVETSMEEIRSAESRDRRGRILAMLTALKQVCNHPTHYLRKRGGDADDVLAGRSGKLRRLDEILETVWDNGERVLVFTQYREMGELLRTHLGALLDEHVPFLHGGVSASRRDELVRAFQEDDDAPPVLLVSLRAGGTGLNLTRATHVVHYDRWWNPAVEDQATDRAYRIGQKFNVQVYKMVSEGTLEERIDEMLERKRELADRVVGEGEGWITELDDDALRALVMLAGDEPDGGEE